MTTDQAGFPFTRDEEEVTNGKDTQMGRITTRYLHPVIPTFITDWAGDLTSSGKQPSPLEQEAIDLENEWSQKYVTGIWGASTDPSPSPVSWELDPPPLTTNHPPRITDSNTRITLREDSLKEPLPKSDNGLDWVQIQQKSLRWEELIQDSPIITHEDLTTLDHPSRGWTITNGTWNALRTKWRLTSETLQRIYDSCATQRRLETVNIFTPTRYILQTIKRICQVEGIHGTRTPNSNSATFEKAGFYQLRHIQKDIRDECWGSKIKGWWRTGDIRVKKQKKIFECWVKDKTRVSPEAQNDMIMTLQSPDHNFGKDEYVVDMIGHET
jgi:hypothetical protein